MTTGAIGKEFTREFQGAVRAIFGQNLVFAFIFGSFAKGYGNEENDVDTFICVQKCSDVQNKMYIQWIYEAHMRFGYSIDKLYPCEIVEEWRLNQLVNEAPAISLSTNTPNDSDTYDSVAWVHIMADKKCCVLGDTNKVRFFELSFTPYPELWKALALEHIDNPIEHADKPPLFFLKRFFVFEERPMDTNSLLLPEQNCLKVISNKIGVKNVCNR